MKHSDARFARASRSSQRHLPLKPSQLLVDGRQPQQLDPQTLRIVARGLAVVVDEPALFLLSA